MFNVLKFVHLLLLTTQTSWDKLCLLKSFDDVSTEAYNRLSIIFPFLSDECGNDSCSCYCIPHWDADSIYSRMRIVTLESSWTLPHANRKEAFNMEINTQSMSWNQIHIPKRIVRDILELLYCQESYFGKKLLFTWRILMTDLFIDNIICTLKWRNKVMYYTIMIDVAFQILPLLTQRISFQ